jgi:hypothetical protein
MMMEYPHERHPASATTSHRARLVDEKVANALTIAGQNFPLLKGLPRGRFCWSRSGYELGPEVSRVQLRNRYPSVPTDNNSESPSTLAGVVNSRSLALIRPIRQSPGRAK